MSARIPTQQKSPFEIDPRPLHEMSSPHAGLLATSRAFRSLGIPALAAAHLQLKQRQRGFDEAQYLEAIVLLQTAGGDCPEDMQLLGNDPCLERGLGFPLPKVSAVRGFLERFHHEAIRVLIDLVVHYTSDKHPWFQEARSDPKSKYRDWYVWSKKKPKHADDGVVFPGVQKSTWDYDKLARAW